MRGTWRTPTSQPPSVDRLKAASAGKRNAKCDTNAGLKTSICIAIDRFNSADFIGEAIESVKRQTRRTDKVVVADTSTDASPEIIKTMAARAPRITTVFVKNRGQLATILAGAAAGPS